MYPLSNSSFNCNFNSANSLGVILYDRLKIGDVPDCSSMVNSTSQSSGMLAKSSGNTSGNLHTTRISSRLRIVMCWTEGVALEDDASRRVTIP
jgi:hypothetical protein